MYFSSIFVLLPLVVALSVAHPFGGMRCNCGLGSGEDVCHHQSGKCTPLVVRPVEVPKPVLATPKVVCAPVGGIPPLVPIGGPCSCHTSLVKPAVVPKPPCLACSGSIDVSNNQHLTLSQKQQILFGGVNGMDNGNMLLTTAAARPVIVDDVMEQSNVNPANYVPADPVSLSVAYKLAQESCNHNEDKLSFGFRSIPKEIPLYIKRSRNNVPEEDLFSLNGQIVELKKIKCGRGKSLDDEAAEQLADLEEEEEEEKQQKISAQNFKRISLGEIGYGLAKIQEPTFINIQSASSAPDDGLSGSIKDCKDGFKPGNVIISQIPKLEPVHMPPLLPEPCPAEDEPFLPPPPAIPPGSLFTSPYTYLSSSSSSAASSSNLYSKSVFLQKVGCNN